MNRALYAAASGMAAEQKNLEVIAANLSNAQVIGFKRASERFAAIGTPGGEPIGTVATGTRLHFAQGKLMRTGGPFDLAIKGRGFFAVVDSAGRRGYTRNGEFSRAPDGSLQNAQGWRLLGVSIPSNAHSANVDGRGVVSVTMAKGTRACGRIRLAEFRAPERLESVDGTVFLATHASGRAHIVDAGTPNGPTVKFGMLEASNVSIIEAMMQILAAQRAYEANAKGVQASDEMMRIADNLSRD